MTTRHKFRCPECPEETRKKSTLFCAVKAVADNSKPACRRCGGSTDLHLSFDFALGVQDNNAKVLGSFYPRPPEDWTDSSGRTVTFYPFLIVTKREERDQAVWLPYWHVVRDGEKVIRKYGQWALFMDMELFNDLLSKARNAGFLNHEA